MATTYLDVSMVRMLSSDLTETVIADASLEAIAVAFADPEIDTALSGFGAPFGFTASPAMVKVVSALLTCAIAFDDAFSQTADESRFASAKRSDARKILGRIRSGELPLGIVEKDPLIDVSESDLLSQPADACFVNNELDWIRPAEAREF